MDVVIPWLEELVNFISNKKQSNNLSNSIVIPVKDHKSMAYLAPKITKAILCNQNPACNKCKNCQLVDIKSHPNAYQINPDKSQISIETTRALQENLHKNINNHSHSVIIFMQAHLMNTFAANSILKLIEEPESHAIFIFLTNNTSNILSTIKSRSHIYHAPTPNITELTNWINQNNTNKVNLSEKQTKWLLEFMNDELLLLDYINNNQYQKIIKCKENWIKCIKQRKISLHLLELTEEMPEISLNIFYFIMQNKFKEKLTNNLNNKFNLNFLPEFIISKNSLCNKKYKETYLILQNLINKAY